MLKADFFYEAPESLDEVMKALTTRDKVAVLAGGTDLIPLIKQGVKKPSYLIDLKNVGSLRTIIKTERDLLIGSMVTLAEVANHPAVNRYCPALAQSARAVASPQIRNVATLAGNLLQERRCLYFNQSEHWRKSIPECLKLGGRGLPSGPQVQDLPCPLLFGHRPRTPGFRRTGGGL
jgi:CO/xanthine dehydrogenase FAD-binding subunit